MADIQVGSVVLPMDGLEYVLRMQCNNKDWTAASSTFSQLMQPFYSAVAQCADAQNFTADQREAMAFQVKAAVEVINERGSAYYTWAYERMLAAPGHGLWGNDNSCNKRSGWWYDNTIVPFSNAFWLTTSLAWTAADDALALLAQEEEGEYQEELWEDQLIQNDIAQGQTLITLTTAAEKANESAYMNRIQQIIVPGVLITVGYLLVKKKSQ